MRAATARRSSTTFSCQSSSEPSPTAYDDATHRGRRAAEGRSKRICQRHRLKIVRQQAVFSRLAAGRDRACHVRPSANSTVGPMHPITPSHPVRPVPRISDRMRTSGDVRWSHGRDGSVHTWTHETEGPEELGGRRTAVVRRRRGEDVTVEAPPPRPTRHARQPRRHDYTPRADPHSARTSRPTELAQLVPEDPRTLSHSTPVPNCRGSQLVIIVRTTTEDTKRSSGDVGA
jgi:hypothetical protein